MKKVKLNDGNEMPILGFGVFQIPANETEQVVLNALNSGYRMIDTAQVYGNEQEVGNALKKSGLKREDVWITSKVWISNFGYEKAKKSIDESLKKLQTNYIDLMLIHQPFGDLFGTWKALIEAKKEGKVKSIGVSNFSEYRLRDLELFSGVKPVLNQIELNPFIQRNDEEDFYKKDNVAIESWASFAEGNHDIFNNEILKEIGDKYQKSNAQVILRWLIQRGIIVIPKSVTPSRVKQNIDVFDFELSQDDMNEIKKLDKKYPIIQSHETVEAVERFYKMSK